MRLAILLLITTYSVQIFALNNDFKLEFGIVMQDEYGNPIDFKETKIIPIVTKNEPTLFGLIVTHNSQNAFTLGSVHVLPDKLNGLKKIQGNIMTIEHKGAVFMRTSNSDLPGKYTMEIYINSILYKTIEYKLVMAI